MNASGTFRHITLPVLGLLLTACSTLPNYRSERLDAGRLDQLKRIVIVPPEVQMFEVSAGGVPERVKGWGDQAAAEVQASLRRTLARDGLELVELPALDAPDKELIDRHLAMFRRLGEAITFVQDSHDAIWEARRSSLDFTVGDGLAELAHRLGADGLLFVDGVDFISTPGRRVMFALTTLAFGLPVLPLGISYLQAGVVEAQSGEVLWFGRDYRFATGDLREPATVRQLTAQIFSGYLSTPAGGE
jgi:hypothetical protein